MRGRGFTVIELLVVLAALALLLSLVAPRYYAQVDRSREAVLRHNLRAIRTAIDQYYADRGVYPPNLAALVETRYLKELPVDPITDRSDSWVPKGRAAGSIGTQPGIADVASGGTGQGSDGTAYAAW